MRVLQIEDDRATALSVELMLKSEGFNVYTTDLGEEGIDLAKLYDYDIILLDLNLPDMYGLNVLQHIRKAKVDTPVMIVTGTKDLEVKVRCFEAGADDYLTKPFHKDEMVARAHAIIRRSRGHTQSFITTGSITINLDSKVVCCEDTPIHMTGKEYQILELLSLRKGTTLTKEMFLNHLYGGMDEPEVKIIDVFICKLRKKLEKAAPGERLVETVWGRGYVLRDPAPKDRPLAPASVSREPPPEPAASPILVSAEIMPDASPAPLPAIEEIAGDDAPAPACAPVLALDPLPARYVTDPEKIARLLAEQGPLPYDTIQERLNLWPRTFRNKVGALKSQGFVTVEGVNGSRRCAITEAGTAWLAQLYVPAFPPPMQRRTPDA